MKFSIRSNRRRNILSNPRAQLKIIAVFVVLAVLFAGTNYCVGKMALYSFYADVGSLPLSASNRGDVTVSFEQQNATLDAQFILLTALSLVVLTLAGVFLSHIIGGPIHRVIVYLNAVARRERPVERLILRRRDFFHDLAEAINHMQESHGMLSPPEEDKAEADQT